VNRELQGLYKPSPDAIAKARDDTTAQVNRILLTLVGTAVFCLLSLLTPDIALLAGSEKLNVPLAGPVSFVGFMLLGPAVLIVLRVYLQIYVEHERRLDRVARWRPAPRALTPANNPLMRTFRGFALYLLLPLAMLSFSWKAAVFPYWGTGLLSVAAAVIAMHLMLLLRRFSWRLRAVLSLGAAILAGGVMMSFPLSRPYDLRHANLSDQWLVGTDLKRASLGYANLARVNLIRANLTDADLTRANLTGADLTAAQLTGVNLTRANLTRANLLSACLIGANLTGADLNGANLIGANLTGANLTSAHLNGLELLYVNLSGANLTSADLTGAFLNIVDLSGANLTGANLIGAVLKIVDLSGADLDGSKGLTQQQLNITRGDAKTILPPNFRPGICSQQHTPE
jgi:uncharacterized protein YjbI with pentapeptide repeats